MPQDSTHPEYDDFLDVWTKCRDFNNGSKAVKCPSRAEAYLPNFFKADDAGRQQYHAYKRRALLYNATGRTIEGMVGAAMRKPPTVSIPRGLASFADNMLLSGEDLEGVATRMLFELILTGRIGLLLDRPRARGPLRLCLYPAECIINWHIDEDGRLD